MDERMQELELIYNEIKQLHKEFKHSKGSLGIIVSTIVSLLIVAGSFSFIYFNRSKFLNNKLIAQYNLLERKTEYLILFKKIKNIEKNFIQVKKQNGFKVDDNKRMTDEEFEKYTANLYVGEVLYHIDPIFVAALTSAESEWNKKARSSCDAKGILQLLQITFKWINAKLDKYGNWDIYDVANNTEAAIRYLYFIKQYLRKRLDRKPTLKEIAWAYHTGHLVAYMAIKAKKTKEMLPPQTIEHGRKVIFYYENYKNSKYNVYWYSKLPEKK